MMKKLILHIYILLMLGVNLSAQDCKSILKIETNDSTSLIYLNDSFIGEGSITTEVEKGEYIVLVRESLVKWNGYDLSDTIIVNECGKEYTSVYNISKKIFIDSQPQNASIIVNGTTIGYTPKFIDAVPRNSLQLQKGSSIREVNFNSLFENKIQVIDFKPGIKTQSFTDSPWFKVLLGSATALGASAAYFKLKADKKYDNYLINKDRSTLDEVDRFDLYSGIALGLLQVNIGYLIYKFLTD